MSSPASQGFPSLVIRADSFEPRGSFAAVQAEYLDPDPQAVADLRSALEQHNAGVVAHFYMDPELQGVLSACDWEHIHISDSLAMADRAVQMAQAGVRTIVVLGVDFMSENVRATLDASGYQDVAVYRVADQRIGCTLAEAADTDTYRNWLDRAADTERALHVIYINTSLLTKAEAQHRVPTITCTSSNVVQTLLQAAAQIPDVSLWYGPDTYMGRNLEELLKNIASMDDAAVRQIHPQHTSASIRSLLDRYTYFAQGVCIVHEMFGSDVAERVRRDYSDALVTAHLEVPGEMFQVGLEAQRKGRGVVGSTSNILDFIGTQTRTGAQNGSATPLTFVLGTEAGMITAVARRVQRELRSAKPNHEVEIVFPVARDAITATGEAELAVVPGAPRGEGCSTAGGCATCPYMKMNSLDALLDLLSRVGNPNADDLVSYEPRAYATPIHGKAASELGVEPIRHMRAFQQTGHLPDDLVRRVIEQKSPRLDQAH